MKTWFWRGARLLFLLLLASCGWLPQSGGTYVWIDAPVNDASIAGPGPVQIEGHASSPDGIARVEILVNGEVLTTLNKPTSDGKLASYQTTWTPTGLGDYYIQAVAYGESGAASEPDTTHIRVGEAAAPDAGQATPAPNPAPETALSVTPTLTSTATKTQPPAPDTPTPTPTETVLPEPVIEFWAEPASIKAGACTDLRWHVENVQSVVFGGVEQPFTGSDNECLCKSQSYPLMVTLLDGQGVKRVVEVTVMGECATPFPPDTTPPPAPSPAVPADGLSVSCRAEQSLAWLPVNDPSGIAEYQVEVERSSDNKAWKPAPGSPVTGIQGKATQFAIQCGWYYRWRVRAIDGKGNVGPWSEWSRFSVPLS